MPDVLNLEPAVYTESTTAVSAIATSPWAKLVAVAGQKQVILYNSETLAPLGILPFPEGQIRVLRFSRNGSLLLAGGGRGASKGLAVVWNVVTGERVFEVGDELDEVLAADISADQSLIALGGPQKVVRVYSTATGELAWEVTKHTDWILSLEFSPDSVLVATSDRSGGLHVWESFTGRHYAALDGHQSPVTAVSWRIDSNVLASASEDVTIRLWELENGTSIKSWNAHGGGTAAVEFCRDGRLVSCGRDRIAKIWDQNGTQLLALEPFGDLALQVSHCDETDRVIAGDWTGNIRVYAAADGARIGQLAQNPPTLAMRIEAAEGLLTAAQENVVQVQTAFDAVAAQRTAQAEKLNVANAALATAQQVVTDIQATVAEKTAELTTVQTRHAERQQQVKALKEAVPQLVAAVDNAQRAVAAQPDNKQLTNVAAMLTAQLAERQLSVEGLEATIAQQTEQIATLTAAVTQATNQLPEVEQATANAQAAVTKEAESLSALQQAEQAKQNELAAAQQDVSNRQAETDRWRQYVALRDELAAVAEQRAVRDASQLKLLEAQAALAEHEEIIAATQQGIATHEQNIADKPAIIAALVTKIETITGERSRRDAQIAAVDKTLPLLKDAVTQTTAASQLLPNDSELQTTVVSLTEVVTQQTESLAALKTQQDESAAALAELEQAKATEDQALAVATSGLSAAQAKLPELQAGLEPLQAAVVPCQAAFDASVAELTQAEQAVEQRRMTLRTP